MAKEGRSKTTKNRKEPKKAVDHRNPASSNSIVFVLNYMQSELQFEPELNSDSTLVPAQPLLNLPDNAIIILVN